MAAVVLIVVILGAVIIIVRQQAGAPDVPDRILDQPVTYVLAEPPWTVEEFRFGDIRGNPVDEETGYRIIDGKKWGSAMVCATSDLEGDPHMIPARPRSPFADEDLEDEMLDMIDDETEPYECPICGEEANEEALDIRY